MKVLGKAFAVLLISSSLAPIVHATIHDHLFANAFDIPADLPANASEAARFLTQATFGPTQADINRVMAVGYGEWIDEQLGLAATLSEPTVEAVATARSQTGGPGYGQAQRLNRWFWQATYAPDQLRQRMAYALSQIFVLSDQSSAISGDVVPMAHYQDLLATDAFGIYRSLLGDVTYNPTMGKYLNAFRNIKATCHGTNPVVCTTSPDENYAREIMQLFSIGLIQLNMDFSPILAAGIQVPTYDQSTITHTAKVFTGFTFSDAPLGDPNNNYAGANFYYNSVTFLGQYSPMACWGLELFPYTSNNMKHDITGDDNTLSTPKTVLSWYVNGNFVTNTLPASQECGQDVDQDLDIIAGHANVAPFITHQLIQRFVTSNPSAAYSSRVATVFKNSGGDLGDVIKAVLTDPEARSAPALGAASASDSYGKLREPILRVTAMWRAFNAKAPNPDSFGEIAMNGGGNSLGNYGEGPLESPTVFNFYTPDYSQPGTFADNNLNSPEFQIVNESTLYSVTNSFYQLTANGYQGVSNPTNNIPLIDLTPLTTAGITEAQIIAKVNANMLYGTMSGTVTPPTLMQGALYTMLRSDGLISATAQERAWSAIYVTMLSPEYATQR